MSEKENRTEAPSVKKIAQARAEGKFPATGLFAGTLLFFTMLIAVELLAAEGVGHFLVWARQLRQTPWALSGETLCAETVRGAASFFPLLLALLLAALLLPALTAWLTRGWAFHPEKLVPDFSRLLPKFGELFSLAALWRLSLAAFQIIGTVWIVTLYLRRFGESGQMFALQREEWPNLLRDSLLPLTVCLAFFSLIPAAADLFFQRWKFNRDLRMTPEELRREQREEERKSPR